VTSLKDDEPRLDTSRRREVFDPTANLVDYAVKFHFVPSIVNASEADQDTAGGVFDRRVIGDELQLVVRGQRVRAETVGLGRRVLILPALRSGLLACPPAVVLSSQGLPGGCRELRVCREPLSEQPSAPRRWR
jgi:hypothetical protein